MGSIDDFLRAQAAGVLHSGEQALGFGHLRCPSRFNAFGVPQLYVHWLGVVTPTRLILFRTDAGGMFGDKPKPIAHETQVWSYDEIARVELGEVEGLSVHSGGQGVWMRIFPHPGCGPLPGQNGRYDIYPEAHLLDDQTRFRSTYPQWLQQQVAAGAFPMAPDKRAALDARLVVERAAQAEGERRKQEQWQRTRPVLIRAVSIAALVGLALLTGFGLFSSVRDYQSATGTRTWPYCKEHECTPDEAREQERLRLMYEKDDAEEAHKAMFGAAVSGSGFLITAGGGVGLLVRTKRRRQAAAGPAT